MEGIKDPQIKYVVDKYQRCLDAFEAFEAFQFNVVKVNLKTHRLSILEYAHFEQDPFPTLLTSHSFENPNSPPIKRSFSASLNPPILHRKELLVESSHPQINCWIETTRLAESIGLFENSQSIGFKLNWFKKMESKGYFLKDDQFLPLGNRVEFSPDRTSELTSIQRHLTAIVRTNPWAPIQLLLRLKTGMIFELTLLRRTRANRRHLAHRLRRESNWSRPNTAPKPVATDPMRVLPSELNTPC